MVHKGADDYALAVVHESLKFTGRSRIIVLSDQINSTKKLASMVRESRPQETVLLNTPVGSSASAGGIENCNYEVEKQLWTLKSIRGDVQAAVDSGEQGAVMARAARCLADHTFLGEERGGRMPYERLRRGIIRIATRH